MSVISSETMETSLIRAIQEEADRIREKAIQEAVRAFEAELRQAVLRSAVTLTNFYDLRRSGENLVLTVRTQ